MSSQTTEFNVGDLAITVDPYDFNDLLVNGKACTVIRIVGSEMQPINVIVQYQLPIQKATIKAEDFWKIYNGEVN